MGVIASPPMRYNPEGHFNAVEIDFGQAIPLSLLSLSLCPFLFVTVRCVTILQYETKYCTEEIEVRDDT